MNFIHATALAVSFLAGAAAPTFAQQTVDRPDHEHQDMLCTTVAMGNVELTRQTLSQFEEPGILSEPSIVPAYPNIRCGEAGLTLLMVAISSGNKNRRDMMTYMFNALHESETKQLNETNYSGETDLDVIYSLGDTVSARFTKRFVKDGAKTACELSGKCEYTDPNDPSRFTN